MSGLEADSIRRGIGPGAPHSWKAKESFPLLAPILNTSERLLFIFAYYY
jgi:hypothetical protein